MLLLSRKLDEAIIINGNIRVKVIEIKGNKVRLGIEAPPDVPINRQEIQEAINQSAIAKEPKSTST